MYTATFLLENHLGHQVYYRNLKRYLDQVDDIKTQWVSITYKNHNSFWNTLPLPPKLRGSLIGRGQVRKAVDAGQADVLFFNTQVPAALLGRDLFRTPYVISTDITPLLYDRMGEQYGHKPDKNPLIRNYKHRTNCEVFQNAGRVIPWSTWTAKSLMEDYGVDPDRIEVIPPGVDLDLWRPGHPRPDSAPARILFVGGELERKGGLDLLEAFQSLAPGSAELAVVTHSAVPEIPGVTVYNHLEPNTPELIELYQSSDVFTLPTKGEAFGIAAMEACAAGLPVVATPVGGLVDIVVDGETGLIIPPGDPASLAEALRILIENRDLRNTFSIAARKRAEKMFDARKYANRILEILTAVAHDA